MHRPPRRRPQQLVTLLLSVALAVVLGSLIYFAVTSLPFLAVSPTSDPTFGRINECLLSAVPSRVGFAVSRDARRALAWSADLAVECVDGEPAAQKTVWKVAGVVDAAYDGEQRLWLAVRAEDSTTLQIMERTGPRPIGRVAPQHLVGTAGGVVVLEPGGRLVSVHADGAVGGLVDLPPMENVQLTASADGERVALVVGGGLYVFEAARLVKLRGEAPCDVEYLWWLRDGGDGGPARRHAQLACGPDSSWGLSLDVDSNAQEKAAPPRERAVLAGPRGPYVRRCDMLPCTAEW